MFYRYVVDSFQRSVTSSHRPIIAPTAPTCHRRQIQIHSSLIIFTTAYSTWRHHTRFRSRRTVAFCRATITTVTVPTTTWSRWRVSRRKAATLIRTSQHPLVTPCSTTVTTPHQDNDLSPRSSTKRSQKKSRWSRDRLPFRTSDSLESVLSPCRPCRARNAATTAASTPYHMMAPLSVGTVTPRSQRMHTPRWFCQMAPPVCRRTCQRRNSSVTTSS